MYRRLVGARFLAAVRLHHLRRRLPRHAAVGLSDPEEARGAVLRLHPDELSRPARRIVVAGARGGRRPQQAHQPADRRPRAGLRLRHRRPTSAISTSSSTAGCAASRPRRSCATSCAISAPRYQVDIAAFCDELCMDWDELTRLAADPLVTIGAHTVNHVMLAKVPEQMARSEMQMSRSVIEASLGTRPDHLSYPVGDPTSAGPREFRIAAGARLQDRGDDAAGRAVPRAPRSPDRAAAHFAQRRASAVALRAGAALGRRDRGVERLPPRRRGVAVSPDPAAIIQRISGIAGSTQPSPATT